jgi:hypothetical protein
MRDSSRRIRIGFAGPAGAISDPAPWGTPVPRRLRRERNWHIRLKARSTLSTFTHKLQILLILIVSAKIGSLKADGFEIRRLEAA